MGGGEGEREGRGGQKENAPLNSPPPLADAGLLQVTTC